MESVGSLLRSERTRQARDLAEISEALCISQTYLRAIEEDDLGSLPGTFFYKSFVKQYAVLLNIPESRLRPGVESLTAPAEETPLPAKEPRFESLRDGPQTDLLGEFKLLARSFRPNREPSKSPAPIRPLDPIVESGNRYFSGHRMGASVAGLVVVLLFCSGFYAWWNRAPRQDTVQTASATPVKNVSTGSQPSASSNPAISVTTSQSPDGRAELNLAATDEVWISVTANGKEVFSGVLKPSQTKTLTGIEAAQMKVGNAGGLDVKWNGKALGPIGPRGQVRTVVLTPENFEILPPPQGPADPTL